MMPSDRPKLVIASKTWSRDSHGLFDYESDNVQARIMKVQDDCYLVRKDNEVLTVTTLIPHEYSILAELISTSTGFIVKKCDDANDSLWKVVRASTEQSSDESEVLGVAIESGTVVKLGRVQILVSELSKETSPEASTLSSSDETLEDQRACKFCFGASEEDNCLISPCDCIGSLRYVHQVCLQRWLTSKCQVSNTESFTSFYWKSMHCELCNKVYPFSLEAGGLTVSLFNVFQANERTIALEQLARESHGQSVHILTSKVNTSLKLGRGHESDLRISDISVSRCHAVLSIVDGKLYIRDNQSKFGTLIKMPNEVFVDRGDTFVVQTGRTVSTFQIQS
eukprot:CAMPEP_0204919114 /NCGR_PEP_ID=MMETSP1397-20131031/16637_1 /ASSEMBLY_ACC=CAM_ASM_000891 /TAXON_ID=49980 /ORGANISM="Climacostomum Climacostomum virens, Strain Stock W-24" /LENGTH=337 /DNA_ID=CAMNT_0052092669 /DNA_START=1 /DNA_END=1014 /DNA_ORIENTATION=+